jgi:hypothetical protein
MKKLLFLIVVTLMLSGCVVYPGYYDGYYDSGYYSYPYGYVSPNLNLYFSNFHGGRGFHRGGHDFHHGGHGGGWRR